MSSRGAAGLWAGRSSTLSSSRSAPRGQSGGPALPLPPATLVVVVDGRIAPDDVAALRDRFRTVLVESSDGPVVCDVAGLVEPDATAVDLLCRLAVEARRAGRPFAIRGPAPELCELLDLCGIAPVLPVRAGQASRRGGRPKSGKNFSVSRKNVIPLIRPPDTSTT